MEDTWHSINVKDWAIQISNNSAFSPSSQSSHSVNTTSKSASTSNYTPSLPPSPPCSKSPAKSFVKIAPLLNSSGTPMLTPKFVIVSDLGNSEVEDLEEEAIIDASDVNATSDGSDVDGKTPARQRQLQIPKDKSRYTTCIDDGTIVDSQNYPKYPNGNTIFVLQREDKKITNWRHIAWTYHMKTTQNGTWTIRRYTCLGVMQCSANCSFAGSPPTGHKAIEEALAWSAPSAEFTTILTLFVSSCDPCRTPGCDGIQTHLACQPWRRVDEDYSIPRTK